MRKAIYIIVVLASIVLFFQSSCKKENCEPNFNSALNYGTFTDSRDGTEYRTISFKGQVWMAENLKYFDKGTKNIGCNVYGQLYGEYDTATACPKGWHIPDKEEWKELVDNLGGLAFAGGSLKETGNEHWQSPNSGATNLIGFTALPSGAYDGNSGGYDRGVSTYFWSSTDIEYHGTIIIKLDYNSDNVYFMEEGTLDRSYPIRCIKDE